MKKTLIIVLAGFILFFFTQCNRGSKEFRDAKKAIKEVTLVIKNGKNCDEIDNAIDEISKRYNKNYYKDDEKMTKEEETKILKLWDEFEDVEQKKVDELGCYHFHSYYRFRFA